MSNPAIQKMIRQYAKTTLGWKLSGAGGGGYLVLVSQTPVPNAVQLKIRRKTI
jgi:galactokinase/mevalonate kinase-like predicted kinase